MFLVPSSLPPEEKRVHSVATVSFEVFVTYLCSRRVLFVHEACEVVGLLSIILN